MSMSTIGSLFPVVEASIEDTVAGLTAWVAVVNDPPWAALSERVASPCSVIPAWDMDHDHLESLVPLIPEHAETIVGIGGGTALDTAKFLAWKCGLPLIQAPTIASVDAGFTDAIGVRIGRRVSYIGNVTPELVVVDLDVLTSAPPRLNRAGIGDILSCHTGLFDWKVASDRGEGVPWRDDLADLGATLLSELDQAADEVGAVSRDGIRFLISAYRRIGAACAEAGHSRFEEGSEHFLGYAYEFRTGAHLVHGELIGLAVMAMSTVQGNDPEWVGQVIGRSRIRAHPSDSDIDRATFVDTLRGLRQFVSHEGYDYCIVNAVDVDEPCANRAWNAVASLPREGLGE